MLLRTLTDDALSWWNSYAQPIGIDQVNHLDRIKKTLNDILSSKLRSRKMGREFYCLTVNGSDLRLILEDSRLAILCPNMKKAVSFLGSLPMPLQHADWKPDYKGCYTNKEEAKGQRRTEIRLTDPHGNIYVQAFINYEMCLTMGGNDDEAGSSRPKHSRQYKTVEEVLLLQVHHEFLLWEGRYHADELDEEGFDVYFQGGMDSDEHFKAQELSKKARVLSDEVLRSLSTLIYYKDLDTTTLRELIHSEGRLIPEDL
ncbi:hypothetical protein Tco_0458992 [Tanacetum coccineum]